MERVPGLMLDKLPRLGDDHPLAARLGARLVRLLHKIHAAGVVHGDLTPCNVIYDAAGNRLVLLDFGHCCLDYRKARPGAAQRGGKRHYVSLRKHSHPTDHAPLHPLDDLEAVCYLLLSCLNALPWVQLKPGSKGIEAGKRGLTRNSGAGAKATLASALGEAAGWVREAQAALPAGVKNGICACSAAGPGARVCWCGMYTRLSAQLGRFG